MKLEDLASHIRYTELEEGFFRIRDILVEMQYLNHTAPTIAYRISSDDATIAYVTDHEPFWNSLGPSFHHPGDGRHIEFLKDADLVIHDAEYTSDEYRTKVGWGHSPVEYVTDVALAANVSKVALYYSPGLTRSADRSSRRVFHELYRRLTAGSNRRQTSVLPLLLDVSHLKDTNDRSGYSVGDDVLRTVADASHRIGT